MLSVRCNERLQVRSLSFETFLISWTTRACSLNFNCKFTAEKR